MHLRAAPGHAGLGLGHLRPRVQELREVPDLEGVLVLARLVCRRKSATDLGLVVMVGLAAWVVRVLNNGTGWWARTCVGLVSV